MISQILDCVLTSMLPLHSHVTRFTFLCTSQHRILVWKMHSLDSETQVCMLFLLWNTGTYVVSKIICRVKILCSISSRESKGKIKKKKERKIFFFRYFLKNKKNSYTVSTYHEFPFSYCTWVKNSVLGYVRVKHYLVA